MHEGVNRLFPRKLEKGVAVVDPITVDKHTARMSNLSHNPGITSVNEGKYTRLKVGGVTMMSNTRMEVTSNSEVVRRAHGRVLISGLGLGVILLPILRKPEVTSVLVVEKCQDVIDLVLPKVKRRKLTVVQGDIFEWKPTKGTKFNVIYHDIWPNICVDNLPEMAKLHQKFKVHLDRTDPECWQGSWMQDYLRAEKRRDARYGW